MGERGVERERDRMEWMTGTTSGREFEWQLCLVNSSSRFEYEWEYRGISFGFLSFTRALFSRCEDFVVEHGMCFTIHGGYTKGYERRFANRVFRNVFLQILLIFRSERDEILVIRVIRVSGTRFSQIRRKYYQRQIL